jgi:lipoate-protein ligase B
VDRLSAPRPELWVANAGRLPYDDGVRLQERLCARRQAGEVPDVLLLLEHDPVFTRGRRTRPEDLPLPEEWYRERGVEVRDCDRGGRVTYHGPGQLVGYPIMQLDRGDRSRGHALSIDVLAYVRTMERALIDTLKDEGIEAEVREGLTGVWAGGSKIGSIGVHVSRGVTTHGFAVNVENDLEPFSWVVPCGIEGVRMTSVALETGRADAMPCFRKRVAWRFAQAFGLRQRLVSVPRLLGETAVPAGAPIAEAEAVSA